MYDTERLFDTWTGVRPRLDTDLLDATTLRSLGSRGRLDRTVMEGLQSTDSTPLHSPLDAAHVTQEGHQ